MLNAQIVSQLTRNVEKLEKGIRYFVVGALCKSDSSGVTSFCVIDIIDYTLEMVPLCVMRELLASGEKFLVVPERQDDTRLFKASYHNGRFLFISKSGINSIKKGLEDTFNFKTEMLIEDDISLIEIYVSGVDNNTFVKLLGFLYERVTRSGFQKGKICMV